MQGASREALGVVRDSLGQASAVSTAEVGGELLSVAALLSREAPLRTALADNGSTPQRRGELASTVFDGRVSAPAVSVLTAAVGQRWSRPRDLVEAVEILGAEALLTHAERDGRIDQVEEELFRFARVLESSSDLQIMLSDPAVSGESKSAVVVDLLSERAQPETVELVRHLVTHPGGPVDDRLADLVQLAATRRELLLADVRAPVPLTEEQQVRLAAALARIYSQQVTVAVSVDPDLLGGAVVRIGDEIIDGSIASRMAQARRTLTQ